jgi:hypothetical protein
MIPVAQKIQAEQSKRDFTAMSAAAGSLFNRDGAKAFLEWVQGVERRVEDMELRARGIRTDRPGTAEELLRIFGIAE